MSKIILIISITLMSACARDDQKKYDLKSPCVSANIEVEGNFDTPCKNRVPVNKAVI